LRQRLANYADSGRDDVFVDVVEVIDLEEESDPPTSLFPENR
jgi:hypothetical protein